jgi:hypothetical protein
MPPTASLFVDDVVSRERGSTAGVILAICQLLVGPAREPARHDAGAVASPADAGPRVGEGQRVPPSERVHATGALVSCLFSRIPSSSARGIIRNLLPPAPIFADCHPACRLALPYQPRKRPRRSGTESSHDSLLEGRVTSELVSEFPNSLLTGKQQGIFTFRPLRARQRMPNTRADPMSYEQNSLRIGTGNFLHVTGN